jgi:hypothetical protein
VDENSNSIPDWWEWENFASLQPGDADFDGDGASNLAEYSARTDPNTISFRLHFPSFYSGSSGATGWFELAGGVPASMSVPT